MIDAFIVGFACGCFVTMVIAVIQTRKRAINEKLKQIRRPTWTGKD